MDRGRITLLPPASGPHSVAGTPTRRVEHPDLLPVVAAFRDELLVSGGLLVFVVSGLALEDDVQGHVEAAIVDRTAVSLGERSGGVEFVAVGVPRSDTCGTRRPASVSRRPSCRSSGNRRCDKSFLVSWMNGGFIISHPSVRGESWGSNGKQPQAWQIMGFASRTILRIMRTQSAEGVRRIIVPSRCGCRPRKGKSRWQTTN